MGLAGLGSYLVKGDTSLGGVEVTYNDMLNGWFHGRTDRLGLRVLVCIQKGQPSILGL
jgi:hypothetical protein